MTLSICDLDLIRGDRLLQEGMTLSVQEGKALWLKGANGVGKSTALETIAGFRAIKNGTINWHGRNIFEDLDEYHQSVGFLGHKNGLSDFLTTRDALAFYGDLYDRLNNVDEMLERVGLKESKNIEVYRLSQGQKRRLAIARLMLKGARLWLLDEPTVGLDTEGVQWFEEEITHFLDADGTALFTSHIELNIKADIFNITPIKTKKYLASDPFLNDGWG